LHLAAAQEAPAHTEFFSGTVVSCTRTEVVVYRKTVIGSAATKAFVIDENTKIEGVLKAKTRVTVRFIQEEPPVHAIEIVVH
jgi:hypothetical protein